MGNKLKSYFHKDQGLKKSYRFMALFSHIKHLSFITTSKEETLIVSSDWLLLDFLDKNNVVGVNMQFLRPLKPDMVLNNDKHRDFLKTLAIKSVDQLPLEKIKNKNKNENNK